MVEGVAIGARRRHARRAARAVSGHLATVGLGEWRGATAEEGRHEGGFEAEFAGGELECWTQGGEAGGDDASGHFDCRPADGWGEGVA